MRRGKRRILQAIASAALLCLLAPRSAVCGRALPNMGPVDVGLLLLKLGPRDLRVKPEYTQDRVAGGKLRLNHVTDGLSNAIAGALMAIGSHDGLAAKGRDGIHNLLIAGGHPDIIKQLTHGGAPIDVFDH